MRSEERQHRIEEYLQKVEFASLEELAQYVGASTSTVRRDLTILEQKGNIRRTHGGARIVNPRSDEFVFSARDTHQLAEKEAIGRACVQLIKPNQSIIIDAGTTVYHVARQIESIPLQIITNSLPVANLFASSNLVELVLSGGVLYPRLGALVGPQTVEAFSKIHVDIAIMGAGGITLEGITNSHGLMIDIQRAMINAASKVIFCLDYTKFGRKSMLPLCGLDVPDIIVTDSNAPADLVTELEKRGIQIVKAEVTNHNKTADNILQTPSSS